MYCHGCGSDQKLVKSHIIPESFFVAYDKSAGVSKLMTNQEKVYPKRLPIGIYDNILCKKCEDIFQEYDDYATKTLLNDKYGFIELRLLDGSVKGWQRPNTDYRKLKIFFLSLLWRSSISTHSFFKRIDIGPFQNILKDMIWNGLPGKNDEFSCVLFRFDIGLGGTALDPHRERWNGTNWVRIYFCEYTLLIRCDKRSGPNWLERLRFEDSGLLTIVARDFFGSPEAKLMKSIVLKNEQKRT